MFFMMVTALSAVAVCVTFFLGCSVVQSIPLSVLVMALVKSKPVKVPGMTVRQAIGVNGFVGYILTLYLIYDGDHCYTLYTQDQWIENQLLMQENGDFKVAFTKEVFISPTNLPKMYNYIRSFDVSQANSS